MKCRDPWTTSFPPPTCSRLFADLRARIAKVPRVPIAIRRRRSSTRPTSPRRSAGRRSSSSATISPASRSAATSCAISNSASRARIDGEARHRDRRARSAVELRAPDGRRLQQARAADDPRARRRAGPTTVQGNLLIDYLLGAEVHFAADRARAARACSTSSPRTCARAAGGRTSSTTTRCSTSPRRSPISRRRWRCSSSWTRSSTAPDGFYMSSSGKGQAGIVLAQRLSRRLSRCTASPRPTNSTCRRAPRRSPTRPRAALGLDLGSTEDEIVNFDGFVGARLRHAERGRQRGGAAVRAHRGHHARPDLHRQSRGRHDRAYPRGPVRPTTTSLVFVHTGGTPAIFTWNDLWLDGRAKRRASPTLNRGREAMNRREFLVAGSAGSRGGRCRRPHPRLARRRRGRRITFGQSTAVLTPRSRAGRLHRLSGRLRGGALPLRPAARFRRRHEDRAAARRILRDRARTSSPCDFKLRAGANFHDGTPVDAAAVKFNVERHDGQGAQPDQPAAVGPDRGGRDRRTRSP